MSAFQIVVAELGGERYGLPIEADRCVIHLCLAHSATTVPKRGARCPPLVAMRQPREPLVRRRLGVTSLSMAATAVADVRDGLAGVTLAERRESAAEHAAQIRDLRRSRLTRPQAQTA